MGKCRETLAVFMLSKPIELTVIILIVVYALYVFVAIGIEGFIEDDDKAVLALQIVELIILGLFLLEVSLKFIAFRKIYLCDIWNIFDIAVILISIVFVVLQILLKDSNISDFFKIRGMFRLLRIFLVIRKVNQLRMRSIRSKLMLIGQNIVTTPAQKILDILDDLMLRIKDSKIKTDLLYASKMISTNKLYDPVVGNGDKKNQQGIAAWVGQFKGNDQDNLAKRNSELSIQSSNLRKRQNTDAFVKGMSDQVLQCFEEVNQATFNPFLLRKLTNGQEAVTLMLYLFEKHNWSDALEGLDEKVMYNFTKTVQDGYKPNGYHNKTHACDIGQTAYYFATKCEFQKLGNLSQLELCVLVVTGIVHDYEHPGLNNPYLAKTKDILSIRYNDQSILENHHVAASFQLMQNDQMNIFKHLDHQQYVKMRQEMIKMVLGTDMSFHFKTIGVLKNRISSSDFDPSGTDKSLCMETMIHFADISNPSKQWDYCYRWTNYLFVQFFGQGDSQRQRRFPISDLMDRKTVNVAKCQIGFIDYVVKPCFEILDNFLENIDIHLQNLEKNKQSWIARFEEYEELKDNNGNNTMKMVEQLGEFQGGSGRMSVQLPKKSLFKPFDDDEKTNALENEHESHKSSDRGNNSIIVERRLSKSNFTNGVGAQNEDSALNPKI